MMYRYSGLRCFGVDDMSDSFYNVVSYCMEILYLYSIFFLECND